ncbi:MAG: hypothetical protein JWM10_1837, partial [Myxococcaceae bacterium]|nr:hypothetical protein [Myxococcaceae bacterium]
MRQSALKGKATGVAVTPFVMIRRARS